MDLQQMLDEVKKLINEQADIHKQALAELRKTGAVPSEFHEKLDKMAADTQKLTNAYTDIQAKHDELKKANEEYRKLTDEQKRRIDELETRLNRGTAGSGDARDRKTFGEIVVSDERLQEFIRERKHELRGQIIKIEVPGVSVKDIVTENQGTALTTPQRIQGILQIPDMPITIRALIPTSGTTSNAVEYVKETGQTNNAGPQYSPGSSPPVQDGALKRKSDLSYTLVSTPVRTIAHYMKASRQILNDVAQLQGEINNRLLYFLALEEEEEILKGDGTGNSLLGIIPQASAYNTAYNRAGDTKIDQLRHALLQVTLSKYMPTNIVLHPEDWHDIELVKTDEGATANRGGYLLANPTGVAPKRLWGYPVLDSLNMTTGDFLVGNFRLGAQIFDRMTASVEIATQNEDDFIRNMVTMLCEERIGLAVYRPDAFVEGSFV